MYSFAEYSDGVAPDSYLPILRELMAWNALCPNSCELVRRADTKTIGIDQQPSPLHWSRQKEWPWAITESELRPWHTCLDVGGSWSVFKYAVARRTRSVTCLDLEFEAIRKSRESQQAIGVGRIQHVQGDCRKLPFADSSFDRVFSLSVYEHMESGHLEAIDEMVRVLKPGGVAMVSMDVVVTGPIGGEDNFYLGYPDITKILRHLKMRSIPGRNTVGAKMREGVEIAVVLIRWVKGGEDAGIGIS